MINQMNSIIKHIVDDNPMTRVLIRDVLHANGIENYKIFNTAEDFRNSYKEEVEICVIDYYLDNGETGKDLIQYVTNINKRCRIIVMSNNLTIYILKSIANLGIMHYIVDKAEKEWTQELVILINRACESIIEDKNTENFFEQAKFSRPQ